MKILVTCPPMLGVLDQLEPQFKALAWEVTAPQVTQTLSVEELCELVPEHDGWIIGDDPATDQVFTAGQAGKLRAAVKWGVGVDNVDFSACKRLGIPVSNTPAMFGKEVADIALGYVIALARHTFEIDRGVRAGTWPKPRGVSLSGKTAAIIGHGDIGRNVATRLQATGMQVVVYDPGVDSGSAVAGVVLADWPEKLDEADFLVATAALTDSSRHMVNAATLARAKPGLRVVNVARGPIIDEPALEAALASGQVYSAALDVFEVEPLPEDSVLRDHPRCIFGSHNASNTQDAVIRTSYIAIEKLAGFLTA